MRRFAVVCTLAGVAFLAPSAALAAPRLTAAERLCERQGGKFDPKGDGYHCRKVGSFSDAQLSAASTLCKYVYGGDFSFDGTGASSYGCFDL
jgi:hypothetical protein